MIVIKITERIKPLPLPPPTITYPPFNNSYTPTVNGKIYADIQRKNKIIQDLVKEFKYKVGDRVEPREERDKEKWGECTIISVVSQYIHLEKDFKWPANDNPMIVTACTDTGEIFYATTNYFK